MKQLWKTIMAGAIGGGIALLGVFLFNQSSTTTPVNNNISTRQVNLQPGDQQGQLASMPLRNSSRRGTVNERPNPSFDFREAALKSTPSVVHISASSDGGDANKTLRRLFEEGSPFGGQAKSSGSGVIYSSDGYIITNNHVVQGAENLMVTLTDNRKFAAELIGRDEKTDLAVIKVDASDLPTLSVANSDEAEIGEWVLAVGNPLDLTSTVTAGIISAKGRSLELIPGRDAIESFLQTDAAVNPGNSGGALVDTDGHLLGINTAIATRTGMFQGYSFAIPVNLVTRIVDDIIEYGSFQRAFLGVSIYPLDAEAAEELGVTIIQGVVVDELVDGGSAQYAGLLPLDIIVKVDDLPIRDVPELTEIVGRAKVGEVLQITVLRKGEKMELPVRMRGQ